LGVELLVRAAKIAMGDDPLDPEVDLADIQDLDEIERDLISNQRNLPFWRMSKDILLILVACCLGALTMYACVKLDTAGSSIIAVITQNRLLLPLSHLVRVFLGAKLF
jgi:hypothetical protein